IILKKFDEFMDENQEEKLIKAEVWFAIQFEMACNPTDFFMRRTGRLFFDKLSVEKYKDLVLQLFENELLYTKNVAKKHQQELENILSSACKFE
ncbi:MAG: glycerol-3-phosphate dehydrogenase, partial [Polaribacter sp.]|nr:glycerol-3-phosphate dehydrogenase [Polaribacter sp.]